jgi:hypothetical protein
VYPVADASVCIIALNYRIPNYRCLPVPINHLTVGPFQPTRLTLGRRKHACPLGLSVRPLLVPFAQYHQSCPFFGAIPFPLDLSSRIARLSAPVPTNRVWPCDAVSRSTLADHRVGVDLPVLPLASSYEWTPCPLTVDTLVDLTNTTPNHWIHDHHNRTKQSHKSTKLN